jgi:hypothetical protein
MKRTLIVNSDVRLLCIISQIEGELPVIEHTSPLMKSDVEKTVRYGIATWENSYPCKTKPIASHFLEAYAKVFLMHRFSTTINIDK